MSGPKLSPHHLASLRGAESLEPSPVPTRWISNGEYMPLPPNRKQQQVAAQLTELANRYAKKLGVSRREFLRSSCGLAAAFLAMNVVHGEIFTVHAEEALNSQESNGHEHQDPNGPPFILDMHTHFVRDDFPIDQVTGQFILLGDALIELERGLLDAHKRYRAEDYGLVNTGDLQADLDQIKIQNYIRFIFLESDTNVALLSDATANPDHPEREFLDDELRASLRDQINAFAGSERVLASALLKPHHPGWIERIDHAIDELNLDCWKGFTVGQNTFYPNPELPWRLDDFELLDGAFYQKLLRASNPRIRNITIHKGLIAPDFQISFGALHPNPTAGEADFFNLSNGGIEPEMIPAWHFNTVQDVPRAAQAYPDLNFIMYHSAFRPAIGVFEPAALFGVPPQELDGFFLRQFLPTINDAHPRGVMPWVTDLASIPNRFGVRNVYSELGSVFGPLVVTDPEFAALLVGILIEGLGPRNVLWGTDAVLLGRPQWVIEAFSRLKIFDIFERYFGVTPTARHGNLTETKVKHLILGANAASLFGINPLQAFAQTSGDNLSRLKPEKNARNYLNGALGYVAP